MFFVYCIVLFVIYLQNPLSKTQRSIRFAYGSFFYLGTTIFLYNQAKIDLSDWHNYFFLYFKSAPSGKIALGSAVSVIVVMTLFQQLEKRGLLKKSYRFKRKDKIIFSISTLLIFLGFLAYASSRYAMKGIGNMRLDQIVFIMTQPIRGSDPGQIINYMVDPLLQALLITVPLATLLYFICACSFFKWQRYPEFNNKKVVMFGILALVFGIFLSGKEFGYADIKAFYFEKTDIYDEYYVDPKQVKLQFPEKKRNLVYIFLESTESSYFSKELGGIEEKNLMPHLADEAKAGIQFSNSDKLGGMLQVPGANQTASSMVAQTSGLPLRPSTSLNTTESSEKNSAEYFPGAYSIGQILDEEDYNQVLLMGSEAEFAGRDKYFSQHGNYEIRDYHWAVENGKIPEDYYEWWGYEDAKLFQYAKETLTELAQKDQPFNLTMLTADTHFEDGYESEQTPDVFGDQYSNVIHYSDKQIYELLQWMKKQPFYENTTVILCGDHLTMDSDFFDDIDPDYQRSVYNVFLNTDKKKVREKNRQFSAVDMFPTTLSALNVKIPGNRMGIGVNLFSGQKTLIEKKGYDNFQNELMKKSDFYDQKLMQSKEKNSSDP